MGAVVRKCAMIEMLCDAKHRNVEKTALGAGNVTFEHVVKPEHKVERSKAEHILAPNLQRKFVLAVSAAAPSPSSGERMELTSAMRQWCIVESEPFQRA